jgi:hypothetical protein
MASGLRRSRYRFQSYRPTSLCIWYAPDDRELKWQLHDGLTGLIDLARQHLVREVWWRATSRWDAPEVHREPTPVAGRSRTARVRAARTRCWCGRRRYSTCHGAIDVNLELRLLGLLGETSGEDSDGTYRDRTGDLRLAKSGSG